MNGCKNYLNIKIAILSLVLVGYTSFATAQKLSITAYGGLAKHSFGGDISKSNGKISTKYGLEITTNQKGWILGLGGFGCSPKFGSKDAGSAVSIGDPLLTGYARIGYVIQMRRTLLTPAIHGGLSSCFGGDEPKQSSLYGYTLNVNNGSGMYFEPTLQLESSADYRLSLFVRGGVAFHFLDAKVYSSSDMIRIISPNLLLGLSFRFW